MGWNECHIYPSREERHDDSQAVKSGASSLLMSRINVSPFIICCLLVLKGPLKAQTEKRWENRKQFILISHTVIFFRGLWCRATIMGWPLWLNLKMPRTTLSKFHCSSSQPPMCKAASDKETQQWCMNSGEPVLGFWEHPAFHKSVYCVFTLLTKNRLEFPQQGNDRRKRQARIVLGGKGHINLLQTLQNWWQNFLSWAKNDSK